MVCEVDGVSSSLLPQLGVLDEGRSVPTSCARISDTVFNEEIVRVKCYTIVNKALKVTCRGSFDVLG